LCRELGYTHPNELLDHLTFEELKEWEAFDQLEPIGRMEFRMEYMLGTVCAVLVNTVASIFSKKGSNNTKVVPADFMPQWGVFENEVFNKEKPKQSMEEMKQLLLSMAKVQNTKHPEGRRRKNR